jgi:dTDP-4-amino-4,6-dideoxygalactose transaminase
MLNLRVNPRSRAEGRRAEFLPLSRPAIGEEEIAEVVDCLRSGWITTGPRTLRFEEEFARASGARHAIALSSATAGFHLAFQALGIGPGDEVITPSLTFVAIANMIVMAGATPIFIDVDPHTLNVDPRRVEEAITARTRAIVPVHYAGLPCDLEPLHELARKHGISIIEDAAHAVGASYRGRPIGGLSDLTIFSFHPLKNLTTAEGGMITTSSDRLAEQLRLLRFHGMDRDAWKRYGPHGTPGYEVLQPGYKYNMTDLQASLGLHQLRKLERMNAARAAHAAAYQSALANIPEVELPATSGGYAARHVWHLFVPRLHLDRLSISRDELMRRLREENIGTGLHFKAVHLHPYYREHYPQPEGALLHTEIASERILSLPLFPQMHPGDVEDVAAALKRTLAGARKTRP